MSVDYEAVQASYHRCLDDAEFFDTFYDLFLVKSAEIPRLFANTDFEKQKQVVRVSVLMMIRLGDGRPEVREAIEKLGESHSSRDKNVPAELYSLWLDTLCECVMRYDPEYSPELEQKWRDTMQPGIELMISMY
jgi:hemoglobin-like flavoprotein